MNRKLMCTVLCAAMVMGMAVTVFAGGREVQLFQSPIRDVNTAATNYADLRGYYSTTSIEGADNSPTALQGQAILGVPVGDNFELNARGGFLREDPDVENFDAESGMTDIEVAVRGRWNAGDNALVSVGVGSLLPIGKEEFRGNRDLAFNVFGAIHYNASPAVRLTGSASIEHTTYDTVVSSKAGLGSLASTGIEDSNTYLRFAPGIIYEASPELSIIGEFSFPSDDIFPSILSGGVDYRVNENGSLRGALGIGMNDAAEDFQVQGGYVISFD